MLIGAFSKQNHAQEMANVIGNSFDTRTYVTEIRRENKTLYQVQVVPIENIPRKSALLSYLHEQGLGDPILVVL